MRRLPSARLVIDEGIAGAALPLSGKPLPAGLGVFPRGSVTKVDGELLRFFIYWRLEQPGPLPAGSQVFTLDRLGDLIPA